jgi:hypothetical protein
VQEPAETAETDTRDSENSENSVYNDPQNSALEAPKTPETGSFLALTSVNFAFLGVESVESANAFLALTCANWSRRSSENRCRLLQLRAPIPT